MTWGRAAATTALACMMVAVPTSAHASPLIAPLIIAILAAAGVNTAAVIFGTVTVGSLISGIVTLAVGIGLALLMAPKPPKPENSRQAVQQAIPPVVYGYGRARVAGAIVLKEAKEGVLYQIQALAGHEIIGVHGIYLNDDAVELNPDGTVATYTDGRYSEDIVIRTRTGASPETAYPEAIAGLAGLWTESHRGDGVASLYMSARTVQAKHFSTRYPYGQPSPSAVLDMCKVFDPRDKAQVWNSPSTWGSSGYDNPIIALIHLECFSPYGARRDYRTAIIPVLAEWIAEANICDEEVALKLGGTERRYRLGGWTTTEQTDVRGTRQQILTTCDGFFIERGDGSIRVWAGKYRAPTITITDADIVGYSYDSGKPSGDRFEWMSAKYCSPANGYSSVDTDPVALDNGDAAPDRARTASVEYSWVQSTGQASRLLRREVSRYGEAIRGELILGLSGMNAIYERWVYVESSIPRLDGVVVENRGASISLAEGMCRIKFQTSGAHVDKYSAITDESSPPLTVARPDEDVQPVPVIVSAGAEIRAASGGGSRIYIRVTIEEPTYQDGSARTDLSFDVRWSIDATTKIWTKKTIDTYTASGGTIDLYTDKVEQDETYIVEVASLSASGNPSAWSADAEVSTSVSGTAPAAPAIISASASTNIVTVSVKAPNSANVAAIRVLRAAPGLGSSDVSGLLYCAANQTVQFVENGVPSGDWDYSATAESASGTSSAPSGTVRVTVSSS